MELTYRALMTLSDLKGHLSYSESLYENYPEKYSI